MDVDTDHRGSMGRELRIVTTCPESCSLRPDHYLEAVGESARRAENAGHHGLLIHSDHRLLDPWVVAQAVLASSRRLRPVVTVQPLYVHPYATARKIRSLAALFDRPVDVVLVAGGSRTDLVALDDREPHDRRYRRLREYGEIVSLLLTSHEPVDYEGDSYRLYKPRALSPLPPEQLPEMFVAASSEAGREAAATLGAHGVVPLLPDVDVRPGDGIRVGIVARAQAERAAMAAGERFPERPGPHLEHRLEMKWADSRWQQDLERAAESAPSPWWLEPFRHRHAQTPYLVGDTRTVARCLVPAFEAGCDWVFLDTPADDDDLECAHEAVQRAWKRATSSLAVTG